MECVIFAKSRFCGIFFINSISDYKEMFAINNGYDVEDIVLLALTDSDLVDLKLLMKSDSFCKLNYDEEVSCLHVLSREFIDGEHASLSAFDVEVY